MITELVGVGRALSVLHLISNSTPRRLRFHAHYQHNDSCRGFLLEESRLDDERSANLGEASFVQLA